MATSYWLLAIHSDRSHFSSSQQPKAGSLYLATKVIDLFETGDLRHSNL
jgi:hypothetical protein